MSDFELAENIERDSAIHLPLERVNYEAGMLLGLEATRAEQMYHRQRLNRLQYWLQGAGTLVGLVVKNTTPDDPDEDKDMSVKLVVSPGIAIDGLGREILCHEPYCVNLRDWINAQRESDESFLYSGFDLASENLYLMVTIRYHAAATGLQPVMARKVNAGTDPVQPSRARDGILLEIIPGQYQQQSQFFDRAGLKTRDVDWNEDFTSTEKSYLAELGEEEKALRILQGQLLYSLQGETDALALEGNYEDMARILLASIKIPLRADQSPIINPAKIAINNLVRPFLTTSEQLVWLSTKEITP